MMNCNSCRKNISSFIEGELDNDQNAEIKEHLVKCPFCHGLVRGVRYLRGALNSLPRVKVSNEFDTVLRARIRRESKFQQSITSIFFYNPVWLKNRTILVSATVLVFLAFFTVLQFNRLNKNTIVTNNVNPGNQQLINYVLDEIPQSNYFHRHTRKATLTMNNSANEADSIKSKSDSNSTLLEFRSANYSSMIAF